MKKTNQVLVLFVVLRHLNLLRLRGLADDVVELLTKFKNVVYLFGLVVAAYYACGEEKAEGVFIFEALSDKHKIEPSFSIIIPFCFVSHI